MQVVLPELDGRLLTGAISFKAEDEAVAGLEFTRARIHPSRCRRDRARRRSVRWAGHDWRARRARIGAIAIVLSGLSRRRPARARGRAGYAGERLGHPATAARSRIRGPGRRCRRDAVVLAQALVRRDAGAVPRHSPIMRALFAELPAAFRDAVTRGMGRAAADDPAVDRRRFVVRATCAHGAIGAGGAAGSGVGTRPAAPRTTTRTAAAPRLCRVLSMAARRASASMPCASRHAWHAGVAAGQGGRRCRRLARRRVLRRACR